MNGGWETLVQEMRNSITSDTGDQIRDLRRNGTTIIHTHTHSHTAAGGGGIGGRGEFRRVVGRDGWGVGENGRGTEAVGVDVDSLLQRVFPLTQKTEKHPQPSYQV